jgi:glycosyltransferase involved in cell wall biosynthesis
MSASRPQLLFVSAYAPYAEAPHAGGRIHYHYVRRLAEHSAFSVRVVGFVSREERARVSWEREPFRVVPLVYPGGRLEQVRHRAWRAWLRVDPHARHGGALSPFQEAKVLAALDQLKADGYCPDVIVLEWTQIALLARAVKSRFPDARLVMTEHDCLFQAAQRGFEQAVGRWRRWVLARRAAYIRRMELAALGLADLVLVLNRKDADLLTAAGVPGARLLVIAPYFQPLDCDRKAATPQDILFFGAMDRIENHSACQWLLDEVMPPLWRELPGARLVILGAKPPEALRRQAGPAVEVTGFVPDVTPFFARAMCLAAPLKLGAGIKIKVLEGMGAGVPVLTNAVGIEGIPARPGVDYLHCESPADYVTAITRLSRGELDGAALGENGRQLVRREFELEGSFQRLRERLEGLVGAPAQN